MQSPGKRILILGGGFGGVYAALRLELGGWQIHFWTKPTAILPGLSPSTWLHPCRFC